MLAVEEPESFLHPGAQLDLRDSLEELSAGKDVTLLLTTHSPFVISRAPAARVIALRKDVGGKTYVADLAEGSDRRASVISDLFRDPGIGDLLTDAMTVSENGCDAVLVVEGETDDQYLRVAAKATGHVDMVKRVRIVPAGGTEKAVLQTVLLRNRLTAPVLALLDHDLPGREAAKKIESLTNAKKSDVCVSIGKYGWHKNWPEVEAEDLWPEALLRRFVEDNGEAVLSEKTRIGQSECFHYGLSAAGKEIIGEWLGVHAEPTDCVQWGKVLDDLASKLPAREPA